MIEFKLPDRIEDNFGAPLVRIFELLKQIQLSGNEPLKLDYTGAKFTHPFLTGAISGLLEFHGSQIEIENNFDNQNIRQYMETVSFPDGIRFSFPYPVNTEEIKHGLESGTYLPILNFPADLSDQSEQFRSILISSFEKLLIRQGDLKGETIKAIKFLIAEAIDNIAEHGRVATGKIFAQAYPTKLHLDICLMDMGRTLLETYQEDERQRYNEVTTDIKAIDMAANGHSTKDYANSRGYGISNSRRILTEGLGGHFFMMSGNAWFYQNLTGSWSGPVPDHGYWPGYFLALRIPTIEKVGFKLNEFLNS